MKELREWMKEVIKDERLTWMEKVEKIEARLEELEQENGFTPDKLVESRSRLSMRGAENDP